MHSRMKSPSANKKNLIIFLFSYLISNIVSGVAYDVYINYLQEASPTVAMSFWSYYGYSAFIGAICVLFVPKVGYKKTLIAATLINAVSLFSSIYLKHELIYHVSTLLMLSGIQLHFVLLAPFISGHTHDGDISKDEEIKWFSAAYFVGYIGYFLSTYLGGVLSVKFFSIFMDADYSMAQEMTRFVDNMNPLELNNYLKGFQAVLIIAGILSILNVFPLLFIKDKKMEKQRSSFSLRDLLSKSKAVLNKDSVTYLVYWLLVNFGMGLFTPYFTIYLNRFLHIDKATSSLLISLSYIAIVLFVTLTPICAKKFGQVVTLAGTFLLSIPFMSIIANGNIFGDYKILIVGIALFMRSGLANLSSPVDSSISMEVVPENQRETFASIVSFCAGIGSILSGHFTGNYLFLQDNGYKNAYYIAGVIYAVACVIILIGLRKYNRAQDPKEKKEEA